MNRSFTPKKLQDEVFSYREFEGHCYSENTVGWWRVPCEKSQEKITRDCVSRIGRKLGRSRHLIWNHIPRHANRHHRPDRTVPQSPKCLSNPYPDAPTLSRAQNQHDAHSRTSCRDRRPKHSHRRRHSPRPHDRANTTADRTRATSLRTA